MSPGFAAWLMDKAPWVGPIIVGLLVVYVAVRVIDHWPLLKYGPRYWRIERKMQFRLWKRKNGR